MRRLDDKFMQESITGNFLPDTTLLKLHVSHSSCNKKRLSLDGTEQGRERDRAAMLTDSLSITFCAMQVSLV